MNFVFISPNFPNTYYRFCSALKRNGVRVLGIGDATYDSLSQDVKNSLDEYYYIDDLKNYNAKKEAVKFFQEKYGKIDFLESNNEYWLYDDARLRTEFNISSGPDLIQIKTFRDKSEMKKIYKDNNILTARGELVTTLSRAKDFVLEVGYPLVVKPNDGVGARNTYKINNERELELFFKNEDADTYFMEEFVNGDLISYDGVCDSESNVIYQTHHVFPTQVMDVVNEVKDMVYYTSPIIEKELEVVGRKVIKAFKAKSRFFHLEFFKLREAKNGLGKKDDILALEVNMRVPGGYTPDLINFAYSIDIYQIWADVIAFNENRQKELFAKQYACYVGRRNYVEYVNYYEKIMEKYGSNIVWNQGMPDVLSGAMGNYFFMAKFKSKNDMNEFIAFLTQRN